MNKNLRLPRTLPIGAGEEQKKTVVQHWDTVDRVETEIHDKGLVDHPKPQFVCPELTTDMLTTQDTRHYTETYVHLLAWFSYSSELLAQVQSRILQYKNMLDILAAEGRKVARDQIEAAGLKKMTVKEFEDRMLLNAEYQEVLHKLQQYQQAEITLSAKVESVERSLRVISRQVEIRRLDLEQTKTSGAIANRGVLGHNRWGAPEGGG